MYIIHERATVFSNIAQKLDYSRVPSVTQDLASTKVSKIFLTKLLVWYAKKHFIVILIHPKNVLAKTGPR